MRGQTKIVVIGGGIAGLATAFELGRLNKRNFVVCEGMDGMSDYGHTINLGSEIVAALLQRKLQVTNLHVRSTPIGNDGSVTVHRRDLHNLFSEAVSPDLINRPWKVDKIDSREGKVVSTDGQEIEFDVLINASGKGPAARSLLTPAAAKAGRQLLLIQGTGPTAPFARPNDEYNWINKGFDFTRIPLVGSEQTQWQCLLYLPNEAIQKLTGKTESGSFLLPKSTPQRSVNLFKAYVNKIDSPYAELVNNSSDIAMGILDVEQDVPRTAIHQIGSRIAISIGDAFCSHTSAGGGASEAIRQAFAIAPCIPSTVFSDVYTDLMYGGFATVEGKMISAARKLSQISHARLDPLTESGYAELDLSGLELN